MKHLKRFSRIVVSLLLSLAFLTGGFTGIAYSQSNTVSQKVTDARSDIWADIAAGNATHQALHDPDARVLEEDTTARDAYSKQYKLSNDEVAVMVYSDPVHFVSNGTWVDLDHTLISKNDRYINTNAPIRVSFAQSATDKTLFSFDDGKHSVRFSLAGTKHVNTKGNEELTPPTRASAAKIISTAAGDSVIAAPGFSALKGKTAKELSGLRPAYNTSSLRYQAISPGMDLIYTLSGSSLCKEITLTSADAWREPVFMMDTALNPVLRDDGSIGLFDGNKKEVFTLPAPYMYDAAGDISNNVQYVLVKKDSAWELTLRIDEVWLNAEERCFPVVVDPTIQITGSSNITDTMVREGSPTNTYNSMKYAVVGYSTTSSSKRNWALYKINTLPTIPSTAAISGATLQVRQLSAANGNYSWSNSAVDSMSISAKMVLSDWVAGASWNTCPSVDVTFPVDTVTVSAATAGQDVTFDITNAYNAWHHNVYHFETIFNYGIQLSRTDDSGSSPNCYTSFYTSEHSTAANKPVFTLYYISSDTALIDGTYYLNNISTGEFLRLNAAAPSMSAGQTSAMGNTVRWNVRYVDSYYVIESVSEPGKYLAASANSGAAIEVVTATDSTVPTRAQWNIAIASGGGCLIQNRESSRYLTANANTPYTTATLGNLGSAQYKLNTWRIPIPANYVELGSAYSIDDLTVHMEDTDTITIHKSPSNANWATLDDFAFQSNNSNAQLDPATGVITPVSLGTTTFTATHKPTGLTTTFTVTVTKIEIYVGMHQVELFDIVPTKFNHTCVIIIAYPGSAYWNHDDFDPNNPAPDEDGEGGKYIFESGVRYATFGAGKPKDSSYLVSKNNRKKDINLEIKDLIYSLATVTPDVVETLYELDENYGDDVPYAAVPVLSSDGYNCNSYTRGLLEAAGFSVANVPVYNAPGWSSPLPASEFE